MCGAKKRTYIYQEELRGVERFSLWVNLTHIPYGILMPKIGRASCRERV